MLEGADKPSPQEVGARRQCGDVFQSVIPIGPTDGLLKCGATVANGDRL